MTCICLTQPTPATAEGYIIGDDGMIWCYSGPCQVHEASYTVSPLWSPVYGWLGQDETAAGEMAAVELEANL